MSQGARNLKARQQVIDAIRNGFTVRHEISALMNPPLNHNQMSDLMSAMIAEQLIVRERQGVYALAQRSTGTPWTPLKIRPFQPRDTAVEADSRQVELSRLRSQRSPVTVTMENDPVELDGVVKLELFIGGAAWVPVPLMSDTRVHVGTQFVKWSPSQEEYQRVTLLRVTFQDGEQRDYNHNPDHPVIVAGV